MQRRSYYPLNNQQLISSVTATTSSGMGPSRPTTPAAFERSGADTLPRVEEPWSMYQGNGLQHHDRGQETPPPSIKMLSEKDYH